METVKEFCNSAFYDISLKRYRNLECSLFTTKSHMNSKIGTANCQLLFWCIHIMDSVSLMRLRLLIVLPTDAKKGQLIHLKEKRC